ncbi:ROK family transcriptional regulator [Pedobacter africanus]|uniref:Sugar kinase of the NBD/HSP70 family, may contain an N-terminal HTH domain n=1 Tax=Pedobacter africanus TaxID=151894 RepID=A0A1W1YM54_9SPHI|nr:ROK family protein [Pedobacter africanus]SMC37285.1 Sugar kinase of the NBD/HSP70 family, may contain an N-terminal HTH domain [Pedobacter africanus]
MQDKQLIHKYQLVKHLFNLGPCSVSALCRTMNMSTPSILKLISGLTDEGWIEKKGYGVSLGGRKPDLYSLKDKKILILCIDIALFHTKIAIIDNNYNYIVEAQTIALPISKSTRSDFLHILSGHVQDILKDHHISKETLIGCSVGMPGLVDSEKGKSYSYFLSDEEDISLTTEFEKTLKLPVVIQNDVNGSSMAEFTHGMAKGKQNVLILLMDLGVGLGIIMDGKLRKGACGFSGELGHIPFVENGALCYCGKHGCLETITSGNALSEMAKEGILAGKNSMLNKLSKEELQRIEPAVIIEAANKGDQYAIQLLSNIGTYMGKGIAMLIQLFNPELIILSGKIAEAKQYITLPMQQAINTYCMTQIRERTTILSSELGENSRLLGYATTGIDHFLDTCIQKAGKPKSKLQVQ